MKKPQTLKGFRDFLPQEKQQRDFVASKIVQAFKRFGFSPLETPTVEYASLLLGKYGDEADKLVYTFEDKGGRNVGLRYDQTVPTARVLSQYQSELPRFFRRYQMQNVFRADKPQKGRFREFTQCDCDLFGSTSPLADAELLAIFYNALKSVGFKNIEIQINDRQSLFDTINPYASENVSVYSIIQSIDKLDKQSEADVIEELIAKGLTKDIGSTILVQIKNIEKSSNLLLIEQYCSNLGIPPSSLIYNPFLARGLDYYTGLIFEARIPEYTVGSVGGGGRYDNLISELTGLQMPAVGFGIGFDRVVEAAIEQNLIPTNVNSTQVLITMFNEKTADKSLAIASQLRNAEIKTEVYPSFDALGKQFKLADQKKIPWVIIIGEDEIANNMITLKNMTTGKQDTIQKSELIDRLCGTQLNEITCDCNNDTNSCCGNGCC